MGLSSSKQKTQSTSTGTANTTPTVPGYIQQPVSNYYGQVGNLMNGPTPGSNVFGPSQLQTQAFSGAQGLSGFNQGLSDAMSGTRALLDYQPGSVEAGQLSNTDLSPYMNPYTQSVIDTSLNSLDRFRQGAITGNQASATQAGSYGGSRHGIADAETNRGYFDQAGQLVANLNNQNFNQARGAAQFDIGNRLGADQFNSQQGLAGANFRLGAANQLGALGTTNDANARANLGLQADLGAQQQQSNAMSDPQMQQAAWLSQLQQLLGLNPAALIGQNVQSSGTQTGTTTSSPSLMSILGQIGQTAGAIYASDMRLKRNIVPRGDSINGTPLYEFEYIDEPGVRIVGVMAQEAPPHAVITHPSGYLMVDYGAL